ncbi:type II toxin-antitoxin system death-on-curing family toxin [Propionispira raffinosivorans]|uniref:type II toxin-antitoxin system death-on-curing family toxin n=1 Tax=Propionispira raffinosivorans TaxID=86959 RepID=UPI00035E2A67|nr:type II toxin-antitoxin system death-on-curing family toxin [Propionispira raffinosivorans]
MSDIKQTIQIILRDVLSFHEEMERIFTMDKGILDHNLLESAINNPFATYDGKDLYPSIFDKAARLCFGLAKNHGFRDGNKRTAVHSMLVYLLVNDFEINYTQKELENIAINVASGKMSSEELALWLEERSTSIDINKFLSDGTIADTIIEK